MSPRLIIAMSALALGGCTGLVRPSRLVPAPHLLLQDMSEGDPSEVLPADPLDPEDDPQPQPIRSTQPYAGQQAAPVDRTPAPSGGMAVDGRLRPLENQRQIFGQPATDTSLAQAAYEGQPGIGPIDDVASLHARSVPRSSAREVQPGDLLFFGGDHTVPAIAVVRRTLPGGIIEAAAVSRGAVRFIRVSYIDPNRRRRGSTVVNSFLRPRRKTDPAGTAYLAGQLLNDIRVLVR